jgi:hypothetical protein
MLAPKSSDVSNKLFLSTIWAMTSLTSYALFGSSGMISLSFSLISFIDPSSVTIGGFSTLFEGR